MTFAMTVPATTARAAVPLSPGGYLFAVLGNSSLVAIDRTTEKVVNTMALPGVSSAAVAEIWTSPDQASVYVLTGSSITVVDTRSMTVKGSYLDTPGSGFVSMAISPDGTRLYAYAAAGWVDVLELPSLTRLGQVTVGVPLSRVGGVVTANNESGYVSTGDRLRVVPRDGGPVSATFVSGDGLGSIVLIGSSLYVAVPGANSGAGAVAILNSGTGAEEGDLLTPEGIYGPITASPDGQYLYGGTGSVLQQLPVSPDEDANIIDLPGTLGRPAVADNGVVYVPLVDNSTQMAKIVDWPTVSTIAVPAAVWAVTLVDLPPIGPGAPTVTALTNGAGQVTVGFTPGTPGSGPTTGYRVTATDVTNPARGGQTATGTASPVTVPGLTNGDAYTFTVTALSADGNSPPSAPSNALTVGVPPQLLGAPPPAVAGFQYAFSFTVTGLPAPTLAVNPGTPLPDGLTFDPSTATISGSPTTAGSTFVDISATNALGQVQNTFTLVVNPPSTGTATPTPTPTISSTPAPTTSPTPTHSGTTPPTSSSHRATSAALAGLASTGMPAETFVVIAAGLLLLGSLLVVTTRLRRR